MGATVADHLGISEDHVRLLIRCGALRAIDVSLSTRPVYRVSCHDLDRFRGARRVA